MIKAERGMAHVIGPSGPKRVRFAGGVTLSPSPTTGDWLAVTLDGQAVAVIPRRSALLRGAAGEAETAQALAANVDVVAVVSALDTELNERRIQRGLAIAHAAGAKPALLLTKVDIVEPSKRNELVARTRALTPDAPVVTTNARAGFGIDEVRSLVGHGRTMVLIGPSGAGKSTLVNALVGSEAMATGTVRAFDNKGRHTTSHRQLLALPGGGLLIDTPGIRGIALWDATEGVETTFAAIEKAALSCRFANCTHTNEPACGVLSAIEKNQIDAVHLTAWRHLGAELDAQDERRALREAARRKSQRRRSADARDRRDEEQDPERHHWR